MSNKKSAKGFTIVELLIVIVVIAILAAISIVVYVNIQRQARNTSIVSSVSSWMNALQASYAANGTIDVDIPSGDNSICLGTKEQYPAINDQLDEGRCYVYAHTSDQLEAVMGEFANISMTTYVMNNGSYPFRGIQYYDGGAADEAAIWYTLFGNDQDCGVSGSSPTHGQVDGETDCIIYVEAVVGGLPINFK